MRGREVAGVEDGSVGETQRRGRERPSIGCTTENPREMFERCVQPSDIYPEHKRSIYLVGGKCVGLRTSFCDWLVVVETVWMFSRFTRPPHQPRLWRVSTG